MLTEYIFTGLHWVRSKLSNQINHDLLRWGLSVGLNCIYSATIAYYYDESKIIELSSKPGNFWGNLATFETYFIAELLSFGPHQGLSANFARHWTVIEKFTYVPFYWYHFAGLSARAGPRQRQHTLNVQSITRCCISQVQDRFERSSVVKWVELH